MIKLKLAFLICLGYCVHASAQPELTKTVVASSGGNFANGGLTLSSTVAELTMVTTFNAGTVDLFQGFQNSALSLVGVNPIASNELTVAIYPNPASAFFNLEMADRSAGGLSITLTDLLGQPVRAVTVSALQSKTLIDVSTLASGMYALSITNSSNNKIFNQMVSVVR